MLDKTQTEAGKWALGINGYRVASEFIEGELGWSSFESREALSKMKYFTRVSTMSAARWPRMILSMIASEDIRTEAVKRLFFLRDKYTCGDIPLVYSEDSRPLLTSFNQKIKKRIEERVDARWRDNMAQKPSLALYRKYKESRGKTAFGIYENNRGSSLLALTRAGMLPTRTHRSKYQHIYPHCIKCGMEDETIPHIILDCTPHHYEFEELPRRLGLTGSNDKDRWRTTRRMLETWENETRRIC
jgi:hypothetical protein